MDIVAPPARWRSESQEIGSFYTFLDSEAEKLRAAEEDFRTTAMRQTNLIMREYVSPNPYIQKMYFEHQRKKRLGESTYPQAFRPSQPRLKFPSPWDSSVTTDKDTRSQISEGTRAESRAGTDGSVQTERPAPQRTRNKPPEPEPVSYRVLQSDANGARAKSSFERQQGTGKQNSNSGRPQTSSNGQQPVQGSIFGRAQSSSFLGAIFGGLRGASNESGNNGRSPSSRNERDQGQSTGVHNTRSVSPGRRFDRMNAFSSEGDNENSGIFYNVDRSRIGGRLYG